MSNLGYKAIGDYKKPLSSWGSKVSTSTKVAAEKNSTKPVNEVITDFVSVGPAPWVSQGISKEEYDKNMAQKNEQPEVSQMKTINNTANTTPTTNTTTVSDSKTFKVGEYEVNKNVALAGAVLLGVLFFNK